MIGANTMDTSWVDAAKKTVPAKRLTFCDLSKGEHKVRLFGPVLKTYVHFVPVDGKTKMFILPYKDEDLLVKQNIRAKYFCFALDVFTNTLHYARFGESLMMELRKLARHSGIFIDDLIDSSDLLVVPYKSALYGYLEYNVKAFGKTVELTDEQMKLISTYDLGQHTNWAEYLDYCCSLQLK